MKLDSKGNRCDDCFVAMTKTSLQKRLDAIPQWYWERQEDDVRLRLSDQLTLSEFARVDEELYFIEEKIADWSSDFDFRGAR
jgi:hypothetical protein